MGTHPRHTQGRDPLFGRVNISSKSMEIPPLGSSYTVVAHGQPGMIDKVTPTQPKVPKVAATPQSKRRN